MVKPQRSFLIQHWFVTEISFFFMLSSLFSETFRVEFLWQMDQEQTGFQENFSCNILLIYIMNKQYGGNQRWRTIRCPPENSALQSGVTRHTVQHSRYTPSKKSEKSSQNKLNLVVLQSKKALQEPSKMYRSRVFSKDQNKPQARSELIEPTSFKGFTFRTNRVDSIQSEQTSKKQTSTEGYRLNNEKVKIKDRVMQEYFQHTSNKVPRILQKPIQLNRIDTFTEPQGQIQPHRQQPGCRLTTQDVFQHCIEALDLLQKQIIDYRIEVHKILEQKQQYYSEMRQKILKQFAKKINELKKQQNKKHLQKYLPKREQKNTLSRITSETTFLRHPQQTLNLADHKSDKKSINGRSVTSRSNSAYKNNFDNIFHAINTIKSELSQDGKSQNLRINQFCDRRQLESSRKQFNQYIKQPVLQQKENSVVNIDLDDVNRTTKSSFKDLHVKFNDEQQENIREGNYKWRNKVENAIKNQPNKNGAINGYANNHNDGTKIEHRGNFFFDQAQKLKNWKCTM